MPLVEYRCSECGAVFERLVSRTQGADTAECAGCGANSAKRLLSVFAQVRGGDGASIASAASTAASANAGGCCGGGGCGCR
ncbi:MAG: zinc ribbon domain-containing protein [Chloroflexi bacterium]|nr:zinc ribbon domain-containing protein [Chloroflexota bacterium]